MISFFNGYIFLFVWEVYLGLFLILSIWLLFGKFYFLYFEYVVFFILFCCGIFVGLVFFYFSVIVFLSVESLFVFFEFDFRLGLLGKELMFFFVELINYYLFI